MPYRYGLAGAKLGPTLPNSVLDGDISINIQGFAAWQDKGGHGNPTSWVGSFIDYELNFNAGAGVIGGVGISAFASPNYGKNKGGWFGIAFGGSIGLGGKAGIPADANFLSGLSYYKLMEPAPISTSQLQKSFIGNARIQLKMFDFMTGGVTGTTNISNILNHFNM